MNYAALLVLILIDSVGYSIIIPVLAPLLLGKTPLLLAASSEHVRLLYYGLALGVYELIMLVTAPVLGQLSDRVGRKPVLLMSAAGISASYALVGLSVALGQPGLLLLGRLLGGATAGAQAVAQAGIVDMSTPKNKSLLLNLCLFASSGGFVVGPALGGLLQNERLVPWFSATTPLWAMTALGVVGLAMLAFYREPARDGSGGAGAPGLARERSLDRVDLKEGLKAFTQAFTTPALRGLSVVFVLHQLAWGAYFLFAPAYALQTFGLTDTQVAHFLSIMGVGYLIAYGGLNPLLERRLGNRGLTLLGLWTTLALLIATPFLGLGVFLTALPVCIGTTVSVAYGGIINLFSDSVDEARQGWVLGITISLTAVATGVSSLLSGALSGLDLRAPLYFAMACMGLSAVICSTRRKS